MGLKPIDLEAQIYTIPVTVFIHDVENSNLISIFTLLHHFPMRNHLIKEFEIRVFDESYVRIKKCINILDDEQIWSAPNDKITSIGNTTLHLIGNTRQWILTGIGERPDGRIRDDEFEECSKVSKGELLAMLDDLKNDLVPVLNALTNDQINRITQVQDFEVSGFSILIHVIEHFSYHTGQISLLTKLMTKGDLGYYADHDL